VKFNHFNSKQNCKLFVRLTLQKKQKNYRKCRRLQTGIDWSVSIFLERNATNLNHLLAYHLFRQMAQQWQLIHNFQQTRSHPEMVGDMSHVTSNLSPYCLRL